MALFGYPMAQENDAERAVRAALSIQRALAELNRENDGTSSLHSAFGTGLIRPACEHDFSLEFHFERGVTHCPLQHPKPDLLLFLTVGCRPNTGEVLNYCPNESLTTKRCI
jgi:hypothetical protein